MTWVIVKSDLSSYLITETEVLKWVIVILRNLMTLMTQKILMKIKLFVLKSIKIFNKILNSFLII